MARPKPYSSTFSDRALARAVPAELTREIATTRDGRDITRGYPGELEEYRNPLLLSSADWGIYDRVLMDDQVKATLEQRIRAVVSAEWDVLPGDPEDPRSVEAGDALKANLEQLGWDRVCEKMLYAPFYGIATAELMWGPFEGRMGFADIRVRHARRFRFDREGRVRLITQTNRVPGELFPDRKLWVVRAGATNDDEPYGKGLAEWLYWPTLFKRNGVKFWNLFLDKYSLPPLKGTYRPGTPQAEIAKLLASMAALANDSAVAVPEGVAIEMMQVATSGIDFEKLPAYMDGAIAKIILSQTMTTQDGASLSQAKVHAGVKLEVVKADADLLSDSFNAGPARWWTDINFGPDVASPRVVRLVDEEEDLKALVDVDKGIRDLGYARTDESMRDTYGDGYEPIPKPVAPTVPPRIPGQRQLPDVDGGELVPQQRPASFAAPEPTPAEADMVDRIAMALADDGAELLDGMVAPIVAAIEAADSPEALEAALVGSLAEAQLAPFVDRMARASFGARLAALHDADTGEDGALAARLASELPSE